MRKTVAVRVAVVLALVGAIGSAVPAAASAAASAAGQDGPNFGSNVIVFNPSMSQTSIQATLDQIAGQQVGNQFGSQRYAIFFEPGTYGSASDPLIFQVGFYTQVAGLGALPGDVTINGSVDVYNQCSAGSCVALDNFWRSLSNLTINVSGAAPCGPPTDFWAVSQAAPMRRVDINGQVSLMDYCTGPSFASGGFIADSTFSGSTVINRSQQQFFTRNSNLDGWSNGVWNQVFLGDNGAPPTDFGNQPPPPATQHNEYTTLPSTPVSQEEPFLYTDANGAYNVFVPAARHDSVGPSYSSGTEAGTSIPIRRFFVANPDTPVWEINAALAFGQNLILTPGVYQLDAPIEVTRPGTVVMGLGFATLVPQNGNVAMETANVPGIKLSGMIFDAGPNNSPALLVVGAHRGGFGPGRFAHEDWSGETSEPTLVQDVFFRIGGAETGPTHATTSLIVNTDHTILDDVWAWRADHGNDVGWTTNTADTGVIVNGDDVDAYGLFVEHYQKFEVIWNGRSGEDVFLQNEMPYDPPSQSAWMSSPTTDGYAAFLVTPRAKGFQGYGMGSYSFFNQGVPIFATQAFQSPTSGVHFTDLLTIFLNASASGGINSVINGVGGSSTAANPDTPVTVLSYP